MNRDIDILIAQRLGWDCISYWSAKKEWYGCSEDSLIHYLRGNQNSPFEVIPYFSFIKSDAKKLKEYVNQYLSDIDFFDGGDVFSSWIKFKDQTGKDIYIENLSFEKALCLALLKNN